MLFLLLLKCLSGVCMEISITAGVSATAELFLALTHSLTKLLHLQLLLFLYHLLHLLHHRSSQASAERFSSTNHKLISLLKIACKLIVMRASKKKMIMMMSVQRTGGLKYKASFSISPILLIQSVSLKRWLFKDETQIIFFPFSLLPMQSSSLHQRCTVFICAMNSTIWILFGSRTSSSTHPNKKVVTGKAQTSQSANRNSQKRLPISANNTQWEEKEIGPIKNAFICRHPVIDCGGLSNRRAHLRSIVPHAKCEWVEYEQQEKLQLDHQFIWVVFCVSKSINDFFAAAAADTSLIFPFLAPFFTLLCRRLMAYWSSLRWGQQTTTGTNKNHWYTTTLAQCSLSHLLLLSIDLQFGASLSRDAGTLGRRASRVLLVFSLLKSGVKQRRKLWSASLS